MELQSSRQLPVSRDVAWIALNDTGVLQGCIPGCESIERVDETTWTIVVVATLGPVGGSMDRPHQAYRRDSADLVHVEFRRTGLVCRAHARSCRRYVASARTHEYIADL